jgi:hypothetical protein
MQKPNPNPFPLYFSESPTVTVVGVSNMAADFSSFQSVTSCSVPSEFASPSEPLTAATVRVGNSLLRARAPEERIRRDYSEGV